LKEKRKEKELKDKKEKKLLTHLALRDRVYTR